MTVYTANSEQPLTTQYYPDDYQYTSLSLTTAITDDFVWQADREIVVDGISVTFQALESSATTLAVFRGVGTFGDTGADDDPADAISEARTIVTAFDIDGVQGETVDLTIVGENVLGYNYGTTGLLKDNLVFQWSATPAALTINIRWRSVRR